MQCSLPVAARKSAIATSAFSPHSGAQSRSACCDSIRVAGHNEPEEFSQQNSFAYFCFGFLFVCFFSALVDGFQTQGTLRNEMEKAVTRCAWCQGMAVTHGSWRLGVHLTLGPRTAPRHPGCSPWGTAPAGRPPAASHLLQTSGRLQQSLGHLQQSPPWKSRKGNQQEDGWDLAAAQHSLFPELAVLRGAALLFQHRVRKEWGVIGACRGPTDCILSTVP